MEQYKEVFVKSNGVFDFYILHIRSIWYVIAYPQGKTKADATLNTREWTQAGFSRKKVALQAVECWAESMKKPLL